MNAPEIITFGCRLNSFESEVMRVNAEKAGLSGAVIVNTCAVTAEAERQARQAIRRARRQHPEARIIVTGCAAQLAPERYAAMPEVDQVIGNREKRGPAPFAPDPAPLMVGDIMRVRETAPHLIAGFDCRSRAFVEVQNGCDHRCTFCIIPFARGNARSTPMGAVVRQIETLVDKGFREVVLTGVDLTSYGGDLPGRPALGTLCGKILARVPGLARLRLSSIDSIEVDPALMTLIADEPRLMPHFHLSIQAGDDLILKRMKRRHCRDDIIRFCETVRARRPAAAFGADLIAGFPTEDEAAFANSLDLVERCGLAYLHVFPYSPRPGTPAARMPQVAGDVRRERARILRQAGERVKAELFAGLLGSRQSVLIEKSTGGEAFGHAEQFAPCTVAGDFAPGSLIGVRISGSDDNGLKGVAA